MSVSGVLAVGTYTVSGTDADASGDTGTFSYVLTVGPSTIAQASPTGGSTTVDNSKSFTDQLSVTGNNGAVTYTQVSTTSALVAVNATGAVSVSGVLAVGTYTVSGTDADASGDTGTWRFTLTIGGTATRSVSFAANGGTGTMADETASVPTALTRNRFTRAGYTFTRWNTAANGKGLSYANGATYAFAASVTLYAQWRVNPRRAIHVVTFKANGGRGAMAAERARAATALTPIHSRAPGTPSRGGTPPRTAGA